MQIASSEGTVWGGYPAVNFAFAIGPLSMNHCRLGPWLPIEDGEGLSMEAASRAAHSLKP